MSIKESGSQIELASVETGIRNHLKTIDSVAERLKVIEKSMSIKESGSQIELASVETGIGNQLKKKGDSGSRAIEGH